MGRLQSACIHELARRFYLVIALLFQTEVDEKDDDAEGAAFIGEALEQGEKALPLEFSSNHRRTMWQGCCMEIIRSSTFNIVHFKMSTLLIQVRLKLLTLLDTILL